MKKEMWSVLGCIGTDLCKIGADVAKNCSLTIRITTNDEAFQQRAFLRNVEHEAAILIADVITRGL